MVAARFRPYILPPAVAETEDSGMTAALDARRKRLYYRSAYTGTKETDVLLGAFAARHLADLDDRQVDDYETLLEIGIASCRERVCPYVMISWVAVALIKHIPLFIN